MCNSCFLNEIFDRLKHWKMISRSLNLLWICMGKNVLSQGMTLSVMLIFND
jgi:hypothetical protein